MIDGTNIQQSELQYQPSVSVESNSRTQIMYHRRVEEGHTVYTTVILYWCIKEANFRVYIVK